jgi:hypothetical protein
LKRFGAILALAFCLLWPANKPVRAAGRYNLQITIGASPVQVWTKDSPYFVNELLIQGQPGAGAGLVYVLAGITNGRTPSTSNASDVTATLCAATSTVPGCPYSDGTLATPNGAIDLSGIWIHGAHAGDVVIVSFDARD